jgi:hypothetical protein
MSENPIDNDKINEDELNKTLSKLNELDSSEDEIDNIIENPEGEIPQEKPVEIKFDSRMIVNALGSLSKIASRKFQIPEIELTNEDKDDLSNALIPFEDQLSKWIQYLPYLPLAIFSIGYIGRIWISYKDKKAKDKEMKKELKSKTENKELKKEIPLENEIEESTESVPT